MAVLLVIAGLVLLVFGGDYLVKGASGLALSLQVPPMLVGMTVVALGTSSPELVVTVQAALEGKPDISIGNVVGSNIANVALILGLTVVIFPISIKKDSLRFDWVAMMVASIAFYLLALNGMISRIEGIIFVLSLAAFIVFSFNRVRRRKKKGVLVEDPAADVPKVKQRNIFVLILFIVFGSVGLIFGARFFLDGAETIARDFGISDRVIAISLVAFGTSVPELAASVIAAFKKQEDISLGNIIGSNLFNILAILGITSIIHPIQVSSDILSNDIFWMLGTSFLILPLSLMGLRLNRIDGLLFVGAYCTFIYLLLSSTP